ncbi:glycosyltransferase family 2 protein [Gymnodinialimonas ceratoperidinii]|uniref:Glycosyltransferase n=1 Tax=Gymnodinialimonas ceratoperidinii TaxID=2856823 RepID=A0A8F6TUT9_9RHOB|nr:glycosyltransferase [Gymnodinialimonas ceratoperidinii]QXT39125.1 glycosyltransferase [Gymnodinialimonas ceratoperidinii]
MDGDAPHVSRLPSQRNSEAPSSDAALSPAVSTPDAPLRKSVHQTPGEPTRLRSVLVDRGLADNAQLDAAEAAMRGTQLSLGQVLTARGIISEAELLSALTQIYGVGIADLSTDVPDPTLAQHLPASSAITAEAVVWKNAGSALVVATARPDRLQDLHALMPEDQRIVTVLAARQQILDAQRVLYGGALARAAEGRAPERISCRSWRSDALSRYILAAALCLVSLYLLVPQALVVGLIGFSILIYMANCTLKFSAFAQALRGATGPPPAASSEPRFLHQPTVTLLVPLLREPEVAGALVDRLRRINYPRERLDVILVVEADDPLTLAALRGRSLPAWMRAVIVPSGSPQTKPRALNYALNYARGDIVGIYDAEDRPEPDQISRVVQRFGEVPPTVACLQGQLDYYNARHNWLSRLFTVEYAAWFRVLLPGVQRMGLVVPLGGTTVFLRRNVLEEVGAWDAHNVTEDAELGLRLTRAGYATEIVETTTFEEANAAALPWIKQRSRWLKGYLMTWGAAMRRPAVLRAELGPWRFWWLQIQFGGAVLGFLTAPLLWSFMLKPFGVWHPMDVVMSPFAYGVLATIMLTGLFGSVAISIYACRVAHLRHLRPITPLVEPYYLFGTIAAWIGLFELMARPFFWAKTTHGNFGAAKLGNLDETVRAGDDQLRCASSRRRT